MFNIFRQRTNTAKIIQAAEKLALPHQYGEFETNTLNVKRDNMGQVRGLGTLIVLTIQVLQGNEWIQVFNAEKWEGDWRVKYFDRSDWQSALFQTAA